MLRALGWVCVGITAHDIVSAYFPDGGHIPGLHAWYFALPVAVSILSYYGMRRLLKRGERRTTWRPCPTLSCPGIEGHKGACI